MMLVAGVLAVALFAVVGDAANVKPRSMSVLPSGEVVEGFHANALVNGSFEPAEQHTSHFGVLKIKSISTTTTTATTTTTENIDASNVGDRTKATASAADVMYAAGFLEGTLTADLITIMRRNMLLIITSLATGFPPQLIDFFNEQDNWVRDEVKKHPTDEFWIQLGLVMAQSDGLVDGYNNATSGSRSDTPLMTIADVMLLSGCGDLNDLIPALVPSTRPDFDNMTDEEMTMFTFRNSHCSALIKVTPDFSDIFMSHTTFFSFHSMVRIMKHYDLDVNPAAKSSKISFSSYPGFVVSTDDFYMMDSGLVVLQTTNIVFNMDLYSAITTRSIYAWQRIRVACALAGSGPEWSAIMQMYNSGTYNNQYMVIDLNVFTPGRELHPDLLWVVEQIPGYMRAEALTDRLALGYWPSYNVPYFTDIFNISGYPAAVAKFGTKYSYELTPRASIFRRDQTSVKDMESLQALMRSNNFRTDPLSQGTAVFAICARADYAGGNLTQAEPGGCTDTKATNYAMAKNSMQANVINGPTVATGSPFSWSEFPNETHDGMPVVFDFEFELMDPMWE